MSDSTERRRAQKRDWARRQAEARAERGAQSYTSEWRKNNPELYENQKTRAKERRALAKSEKK